MKIGIMTFHGAPNHGAALQAYALQTQLIKMGHEPFFVNYQHGGDPQKGVLGWIGSSPQKTLHKINSQLKKRAFKRFQNNYLKIDGKKYFDQIQLKNDPPLADAYICGSDQIWNPIQINLKKDEHAYWLDFGPKTVKRIAYAPSFGTYELSNEILKSYSRYAMLFDAISIREESGIGIMKSMGLNNVVQVPDPTLLLEKREYKTVEEPTKETRRPRLFSYHIESQRKRLVLTKRISDFICKELNLITYEALSMSCIYNITNRRYLSPSEWLSAIRKSKFVFTNSFHGAIFSLLLHRPFIIFMRDGAFEGLNSRIDSLLKLAGLKQRAIKDFDPETIRYLCQEEIDWDKVDMKIRKYREIGQEFLFKAFL